jgi:hypothetical protein
MKLKDKIWLRMSEYRILRRMFGLKQEEVTGGGENCIIRL